MDVNFNKIMGSYDSVEITKLNDVYILKNLVINIPKMQVDLFKDGSIYYKSIIERMTCTFLKTWIGKSP